MSFCLKLNFNCQNSFNIKILIIIAIIFQFFYTSNSQLTVTDTLNSNLVAATTYHVFTFSAASYSVLSGTYIQIDFSTNWNIASATGPNIANDDFCETGCTMSSVSITKSTSPNKIILHDLFPNDINSENFNIQFTISNIVNPSYVMSQSFNVFVYMSDGTLTDLAIASVSISPNIMSCSAVPNINTISTYATYAFTINPVSTLPSTGYMVAKFPTQWGDSSYGTTFNTSSIVCSNPLSSVSCTQPIPSQIKLQNLLITNSASPFQFSITNIFNPGSATPGANSQLMLLYYTSGSQQISYCNVKISNLQPKTLTNVNFNLNCLANQEMVGTIIITIVQKPLISDKMQIIFPSTLILQTLTKVFIFAGTDNTPLNTEPTIQKSSSSVNASIIGVSFFPFATQSLNYFTIQFYSLTCPPTIVTTSSLTVNIYRFGNIISTYQCCSITPALPTFLASGMSIQLSNYQMSQSSTYRFSILRNSSLGIKVGTDISFIDIQFSNAFNFALSSTYSCYIQGYTTTTQTKCQVSLVNSTTNRMSISIISPSSSNNLTTIIESSSINNESIGLVILNINNPSSILTTSFNIFLVDSSHNKIQGYSNLALAFQVSTVQSASLYSDSYKVYDLTTYHFTISNTNMLRSSTMTVLINIQFPSTISLDSSLSAIQCKINSTVITCTKINSTHVSIQLPNTQDFSQYQLFNSDISVNNVRNPYSFKKSDSFKILIQQNGITLQGYGISISGSLTIQMNQTNNIFTTLTITPFDMNVNAINSYSISYSLPFALSLIGSSLATLQINFPSDFLLINCSTCKYQSQFLLTTQTGTLTIFQMQNPGYSLVSSSIIVNLLIDEYDSLQKSVSLTNFNVLEQIFSIYFSHTIMGKDNVLEFTINNIIQRTTGLIKILVPSQFSFSSTVLLNATSSSCLISSVTKSVVGSNSFILIQINNIQVNTLNLNVYGLINPKVIASSTFVVQTFTSTLSGNKPISKSGSTTVIFNALCGGSCETCTIVGSIITACLSCYNDSSITNLKYFSVNNSSCIPGCTTSQFVIISDNYCYDCDASCKTCFGQAKNCTSCLSTNLFEYTCILNCPLTYYSSSNICTPCQSNCLTCMSSAYCTYCVYGMVLQPDFSCSSSSCPTGFYNNSNKCSQCVTNCSICDQSGCKDCTNSTYLIDGQCVLICPNGYFIDPTLKMCQLCSYTCKYCSIYSNNCTGCDTNSSIPYYYPVLNQCLNACPPLYYENQQKICLLCVSPCQNCNSPTNCTSCVVNYFYFSPTNQCVSSCSTLNNTIVVSNQCKQCTSPCLQCSSSVLHCTSCIQGYFLDTNMNLCNTTCNSPYMAINRICRLCVSPCSTCNSGQPYNCTSCITNYNLLDNNCYSSCPPTTYKNGLICSLCTSGCYQCVGTSATCTSCYPGTYLYQSSCIPTCPTSPQYYYQYQSQCLKCQSPCKTCLSSPVQCGDCLFSTDYWNSQTLTCNASCQNPYFQSTNSVTGALQCQKCQYPCRQCTTNYNLCASCPNGLYLSGTSCLSNCPQRQYQSSVYDTTTNLTDNICISCPNLCLTCNQNKCITCQTGMFLYKQYCYNGCPVEAPYSYLTYCRNCLKNNCLLCNNQNQCVMCFANFYLMNGECLSSCPQNYEPDSLTHLSCIQSSNYALLNYLKDKQKYKILMFPSSILMVLLLICMFFIKGHPIRSLNALISIPQVLATIMFSYFYIAYQNQDFNISTLKLSSIIIVILLIANSLIHTFHVYKLFKQYFYDENFSQWYKFGNNQIRTITTFVVGGLNPKFTLILFSGFLGLPFTSYRLRSTDDLKTYNWVYLLSIFTFTVPFIFLAIYAVILQKIYLINFKVFFSSLDILIVIITSLTIQIVSFFKTEPFPVKYQKYIIEKVSNLSLPAYSEPQEDQIEEEGNMNQLHHANSIEQIKNNEQMDKIQFNSVYDPDQYIDPPKIPKKQLAKALKKGQFRRSKQKKKKKGKGKYKLDMMDVISQESSESQDQTKKLKKKKMKKQKNGFMNNYIYWKPPEHKGKNQKIIQNFKQNKNQIMKKIYEKQSEFDTITNNDIIFQDLEEDHDFQNESNYSKKQYQNQEDESMENIMDEHQIGSRRQLNKARRKNSKVDNQIDMFFNLNYARKRHLNKDGQEQQIQQQ